MSDINFSSPDFDAEESARETMGDTYVDGFISAYIECALWSETADIIVSDDGIVTEAPTDGTYDASFESLNFDASDLSDDAQTTIDSDCCDFIAGNHSDLTELVTRGHAHVGEWSSAAQCGHDFWLTRNGHGAGFWDRGYGAVGDRLTSACEPYGESHLYGYAVTGDLTLGVYVTDIKIGIE